MYYILPEGLKIESNEPVYSIGCVYIYIPCIPIYGIALVHDIHSVCVYIDTHICLF